MLGVHFVPPSGPVTIPGGEILRFIPGRGLIADRCYLNDSENAKQGQSARPVIAGDAGALEWQPQLSAPVQRPIHPRTVGCQDKQQRGTGPLQNSNRAWNAIIRGELSPPNPTPNSPVGGEVG